MFPKSVSKYYSNCGVFPPDADAIMFRCDAGRMQFYLDNQLATVVQDNPPIIRLSFMPKGRGHTGDPYFTQALKNCCVVCGVTDNLTSHHIVPEAYRRYFPRDQQRNWAYDVLLLCIKCHDRYEDDGDKLRAEIAQEHGVPAEGWKKWFPPDGVRFIKACFALHRHGGQIPPARRAVLEADIREYLGPKLLPSMLELVHMARQMTREAHTTSAAEVIMKTVTDIDDFAIRWRLHFVETMKPAFLPMHWDPRRRVYSESDPNK